MGEPSGLADGGLPPRFVPPRLLPGVLFTAFLAFFVWSLAESGISLNALLAGLPHMGQVVGEMLPPDASRLDRMLGHALVTLQMAVAGAGIGIAISLPLAFLGARNHTPGLPVYIAVRGLFSFLRTVPELFWALFFVATVGLGPFAGTMAIVVETVGFCGRFFAESLEEVDPGPAEALGALGAGRLGVIACASLPMAMPGLVASGMFSLEKAVRASTVLGLVGAGGIGAELETAINMYRWDQACTTILLVLALVVGVEQAGSWIRTRMLRRAR